LAIAKNFCADASLEKVGKRTKLVFKGPLGVQSLNVPGGNIEHRARLNLTTIIRRAAREVGSYR